ncbi:MAG: hypothetical protein F6K11_19425 [Leptolyngbya sp. SIO3F4]|nr:hypothetical protein [Leptolyngbya sp. SIO3F4]
MKKPIRFIISTTALSLLAATFYTVANAQHPPTPNNVQSPTLQPEPQPQNPTIDPMADNNGVYHFQATSGDIFLVTVKQEKTPYTRACYPHFFNDPRISLWEASLPTYEPDTVKGLIEIHEDGNYSYSIQYSSVAIADLGIGPNDTDNARENSPTLSDCKITVELAKDYDRLWAMAYQLRLQPERRTEALSLYQQAVEAEPPYPLPYLGYLALLIKDYGERHNIDINEPNATGPMFMEMPEAQRQSILQSLEHLVRIFEANPSWQNDEKWSNPDFLRTYAAHVETGIVSEELRNLWPTK